VLSMMRSFELNTVGGDSFVVIMDWGS